MVQATDGVIEITQGTGKTTPRMGGPVTPRAKFYDLVMQASIILVDGQRVEQFTVNVYTRSISLTTASDKLAGGLFDGQVDVQIDTEGRATIKNNAGVAYRFEFYHATPVLPVTRVG